MMQGATRVARCGSRRRRPPVPGRRSCHRWAVAMCHHIRTEERNGVGFLRQVKSGLGPRYMALRARDRHSLVIRGGSEATARSDSLTRVYENLVLTYLASLLYLYPYGISLGPAASIRVTDVLGLLCLLLGGRGPSPQERLRIDPVFLAVMGPFVSPGAGNPGYRGRRLPSTARCCFEVFALRFSGFR